jgi:hypothetical protein
MKDDVAMNLGTYGGLRGTTVLLTKGAFFERPNTQAESLFLQHLIVHEASHTSLGSHNCGSSADRDENGAYGSEIKYMIQVAQKGRPGLSSVYDREYLVGQAISRANTHICNSDARKRLIEQGRSVVSELEGQKTQQTQLLLEKNQ